MPEEPKEQLEFLRREDIRTMAKDMARLREEESKKERERIIQLQTSPKGGQEAARVPLMPARQQPEPQASAGGPASPAGRLSVEAIGGELPRPPSRTKKIFVRIVITLLVLFIAVNIVALAYSFWKNRGI
ncbi:MAG: hypothetical protein HY458_01920 [Parcubacteria group bacterium]|nr:hypothetical protein [Parcubacteria group bacterium]